MRQPITELEQYTHWTQSVQQSMGKPMPKEEVDSSTCRHATLDPMNRLNDNRLVTTARHIDKRDTLKASRTRYMTSKYTIQLSTLDPKNHRTDTEQLSTARTGNLVDKQDLVKTNRTRYRDDRYTTQLNTLDSTSYRHDTAKTNKPIDKHDPTKTIRTRQYKPSRQNTEARLCTHTHRQLHRIQ